AALIPTLSQPASALVIVGGGVELDTGASTGADVTDSTPTTDPRDWGSMFSATGAAVTANLPTGTIDTAFTKDFVVGASGPDTSYYQPSTKDDQPINAAGGSSVWGCTSAANPTDKNEILNAYAAAVTAQPATNPADSPDAGDLIIYT